MTPKRPIALLALRQMRGFLLTFCTVIEIRASFFGYERVPRGFSQARHLIFVLIVSGTNHMLATAWIEANVCPACETGFAQM